MRTLGDSVPREAFASAPPANRRRYRSPARKFEGERKRAALIAAVIELAHQGNYRGTAQQIADLAGERRQSICRYFGNVDLLYRVVAREHWRRVRLPAAIGRRGDDHAKNNAWLVLVGKPRELSSEELDGARKGGSR